MFSLPGSLAASSTIGSLDPTIGHFSWMLSAIINADRGIKLPPLCTEYGNTGSVVLPIESVYAVLLVAHGGLLRQSSEQRHARPSLCLVGLRRITRKASYLYKGHMRRRMRDSPFSIFCCFLSFVGPSTTFFGLLNRLTALTMHSRFSAIYLFLAGVARAQTEVTSPISEDCGPSVVCVNKYANVLP